MVDDDDDEDEGPLWWQSRVTLQEFTARREAVEERVKEETQAQRERNEINQQRWKEFGFNSANRSWAIWREYKAGGTTLEKVGKNFGITTERVRQVVRKYDRKLRDILNPGINKQWDNVSDKIRDATLGVEFVFRNDLEFNVVDGDQKGWDQLEPDRHKLSAYRDAVDWWKPEWGQQDTSPTKPKPAYTFYKTIIEKEQNSE
jgi:hypothetical protein